MEIQRVFMCRVPTPNVCQTFGHQIINEFHWSMNSSKNFRLKMHSRQKFSFKQIYSFNNIFSKMYSVPKSSSCTISSQKTFRSFYPHRKKNNSTKLELHQQASSPQTKKNVSRVRRCSLSLLRVLFSWDLQSKQSWVWLMAKNDSLIKKRQGSIGNLDLNFEQIYQIDISFLL